MESPNFEHDVIVKIGINKRENIQKDGTLVWAWVLLSQEHYQKANQADWSNNISVAKSTAKEAMNIKKIITTGELSCISR